MLTLHNTKNLAGIEVSGDFGDLYALYDSLHTVVGEEGEFSGYDGARLRVLGVCYDLRHAYMGDRETLFIENGMDVDHMRLMGIITPEKNLYYKVDMYYPETIFAVIALNDFIRLYAKKQAKSTAFPLLDRRALWDSAIANVRLFQSLVASCLKEAISDASFRRVLNLMHKEYPWTDGYTTQYLDMLNIRYLNTDTREDRKKQLPTIIKRMVEKGKEYQEIEYGVREAARAHGCPEEDIRLAMDYPEEIDW